MRTLRQLILDQIITNQYQVENSTDEYAMELHETSLKEWKLALKEFDDLWAYQTKHQSF